MLHEILLQLSFLTTVVLNQDNIDTSHDTVWIEDQEQRIQDPEAALEEFAEKKYQGPSPRGLNLGFKAHPHWFLTRIKSTNPESEYIMSFEFPGLDEIQIWLITSEGIQEFPRQGDQHILANRYFQARTSNVRLALEDQGEAYLLYKIDTASPLQAGARISSVRGYFNYELAENCILWSIYGTLLVMFFYNLFLALILKSRLYIIYSVYVLSNFAMHFSILGSFFQYVIPDNPEYSNQILFNAIINTLLTLEFTRQFLNLKNSSPNLHKVVIGLQAIILSMTVFYPLYGFRTLNTIFQSTVPLYPIIILVIAGISLFKGQKEARFFIFAFTMNFLAVFVFLLKNLGILPYHPLIQLALPIGTSLQVTIMAIALADRMRLLEKANKEAACLAREEDEKHKKEIMMLNASLESRVEEQTRDIKSLLDNTRMGIFSIVDNLRIHKDYSRYLEEIMETKDLAGRQFEEVFLSNAEIGPDEKNIITTAISFSLGEDRLAFEANSACFPRELRASIQQHRKILKLEWSPVLNSKGIVEKVLISLHDSTENEQLRMRAEEQESQIRYIYEIISIGGKSAKNLDEHADHTLADLWNSLSHVDTETCIQPDLKKKLYVLLHTLKGATRLYKLKDLTDRIHEAEEYLSGSLDTKQQVDKFRKSITAIAACHQNYKKALAFLHIYVENPLAVERPDRLYSLKSLTLEFEKIGNQLALEMGKAGLKISNEMKDDLSLSENLYQSLSKALFHIVRNSVDHGLENAIERRNLGKPDHGTLRFFMDEQQNLGIADDGRGLNITALKKKGEALGRPLQTLEDICELIFESGLSTKMEVDTISGRGVGMEAVRSLLQAAGSDIRVIPIEEIGGWLKFYFAICLEPSPTSALRLQA